MNGEETDPRLRLITKYENPQDLNIRNYRYDKGHTAQGHYQITNTNWRDYGPLVGIDTKKYPDAMSASKEDQRKVALHLLDQTPMGIRNWSDFNVKLKAALDRGELEEAPSMANLQDTKKEPVDYSNMSDDQILELIKKDPNLSKRLITAPPTKPESQKSTMEKWATAPDIANLPPLPFPGADWVSNVTIPGIKQMIRGARGYQPTDRKTEYTDTAKTADFLKGAAKVALPLGAPAFAAAPVAGLVGLGTGAVGDWTARTATEALGGSPDAQDIAGLAGGAISGALGTQIPGLMGSIYKGGVQVAPAMVRAAARLPIVNKIPLAKTALDFLADSMLSRGSGAAAAESAVKSEPKAAPTGKVDRPKVFKDPEYDKLAAEGHLPLDKYEIHLRKNGVPEEIIQAKLAKAQKAMDAEAAKNAPPPVTLRPTPPPRNQMELPGMETGTFGPPKPPGPPPNIPNTTPLEVPPGVQATGPQGQPMGPQLNLPMDGGPPVQQELPGMRPIQPNAPPSPMGGPIQQNLPLGPGQGPAQPYQPELPLGPVGDPRQMGLPGVNEPFGPVKPPALQLPGQGPGPALPVVRPPGSEVNPANIQRQLPTNKPLTEPTGPSVRDRVNAIASLATKWDKTPPRTTNKTALSRWIKELGFTPSRPELSEAREIYQSRRVAASRERMP